MEQDFPELRKPSMAMQDLLTEVASRGIAQVEADYNGAVPEGYLDGFFSAFQLTSLTELEWVVVQHSEARERFRAAVPSEGLVAHDGYERERHIVNQLTWCYQVAKVAYVYGTDPLDALPEGERYLSDSAVQAYESIVGLYGSTTR